jgi:hypothetical protein
LASLSQGGRLVAITANWFSPLSHEWRDNALLGLSEIPDRIQILKPLVDKWSLTFFLIKTQISGFC